MFELLQNYFFTGVTGNSAYAILQKFWQQLFGKELEDLYLDAFEQAVANQRSQLSKYGDLNKLDREALRRALQANLALELGQTSLSDLSEDMFVQRLAETMHTREVLTIGGHNLALEDYQQLLRNLIRQANITLRQKVRENEVAFDQVLLTEVQDNHQQLEQVQTYLNIKFNVVLNQLTAIKTNTSLLPEIRAKLQQVADDIQLIRSNQVANVIRVQLYLQGDFPSLTPDRQSSIIDTLAGLLKTPVETIKVYRVYEGSIVFDLGVPSAAVERLRILLQTNHNQLRLLNIEKLIIYEEAEGTEEWIFDNGRFNLLEQEKAHEGIEEPAAKYRINIGTAQGIAIGDNAKVINSRELDLKQESNTSPSTMKLALTLYNPELDDLREQLTLLIPPKDPTNPRKAEQVSFRLHLLNPTDKMARYIQIEMLVKAHFLAYRYENEPVSIEPLGRWEVNQVRADVFRCFFEGGANFVCHKYHRRDLGVVNMQVPCGEADGGEVKVEISYKIEAEEHTGSSSLNILLQSSANWRY